MLFSTLVVETGLYRKDAGSCCAGHVRMIRKANECKTNTCVSRVEFGFAKKYFQTHLKLPILSQKNSFNYELKLGIYL